MRIPREKKSYNIRRWNNRKECICSLCGNHFKATGNFSRFCKRCKEESEVLMSVGDFPETIHCP